MLWSRTSAASWLRGSGDMSRLASTIVEAVVEQRQPYNWRSRRSAAVLPSVADWTRRPGNHRAFSTVGGEGASLIERNFIVIRFSTLHPLGLLNSRDPHDVLGVERGASARQIRLAFLQ